MTHFLEIVRWLCIICISCQTQDIKLWPEYSNVCGDAISTPKQDNPYVKYFGDFNSYEECQSACINYTNANPTQRCESYTYFQANSSSIANAKACYARINDPQFCPCKNISQATIIAEIYWPCQSDMDCSLNGNCSSNGVCQCRPQWKGERCQLLNLGPVKKDYMNGNHYWGFAPDDISSWGGCVLLDDDRKTYHMFFSYFPGNCGHIADTMNSHVHHAISHDGPLGPYKAHAQIADEWSHEPFATRGPNGEYVVYFSYTRNDSYNFPTLCDCKALNGGIANGTTPQSCCDDTPNACNYSEPTNLTRHTTVMRYTNDIKSGKWSEIQYLWPASERGPSNSDTNFVCKIFPNGTVLGYSRRHTEKGTNVLYFVTATMWNDTSTYVEHYNESIFPQWAYRGNEDPFIYQDINGYYHLLFHNEIPDPGHDQYFAGAHAASYDGINWVYFGYAYDTNITFIGDDNVYYILHSRERPHLVFAEDGVTPLALINGVLVANNTCGNDRSITFLQPINQN